VLKLAFSDAARLEGAECKESGLAASPLACNVQKTERTPLSKPDVFADSVEDA
jgi:hypothetical protein